MVGFYKHSGFILFTLVNILELYSKSHLFIDSSGKYTREKKNAEVNSKGFVLVASRRKLWEDFSLKMWTRGVRSEEVFQDCMETPGEVFDSSMWVHSSKILDVTTEDWLALTQTIEPEKLSKNEALSRKVKKGRFDFVAAAKTTTEFIQENVPANTLKSNQTVLRIFDGYLKEFHEESAWTVETVPEEKLPEILCNIFQSLTKEGGEPLGAGTIQTYHYAFQRILVEKRNVDISKDAAYGQLNKVVALKQRKSCEQGQVVGKHRSGAIPPAVLRRAWQEGKLGGTNPHSLAAAIKVHFQSAFGLRSREEMWAIRNEDLREGPKRADGLPMYIQFSERVTKTRKGAKGNGAREFIPKLLPDDQNPEWCGIRLFRKFTEKKPLSARNDGQAHVFLSAKTISPSNWEDVEIWYSTSNMGKDTLGSLVKNQIEKLDNLDTQGAKITERSIRKTLIDGLMSAGTPSEYVSQSVGHSKQTSKENYMSHNEITQRTQERIRQNVMLGTSSLQQKSTFNDILQEETVSASNHLQQDYGLIPDHVIEESASGAAHQENLHGKEKFARSEAVSIKDERLDQRKLKAKAKKRKKHRKRKEDYSDSSTSSSSSEDLSEEEMKERMRQMKRQMKKLERQQLVPQYTFPQHHPQPFYPSPFQAAAPVYNINHYYAGASGVAGPAGVNLESSTMPSLPSAVQGQGSSASSVYERQIVRHTANNQ